MSSTGTPEIAPRRHRHTAVVVAVFVATVLLSLQLLVQPVVGLANNGDFERVMGYVGLQYLTTSYADTYTGWILTRFAIVRPNWYRSGYLSSETLLAAAARLFAVAFAGGGVFDIRILAGLQMLLYLIAIGILAGSLRDVPALVQWLAALLLLFVFTDVGYAANFNSLYASTASLLFFLLTAAVAAAAIRRGLLNGWLLLIYFVCAALFVGSRAQESVHGPILAVLGLALARARIRRWWRQAAVWLAVGLCAFSLWYYRQTPSWLIRDIALYHTLFTELLAHSPDPPEDLARLGLDPAFVRYAGTSPYAPDTLLRDPAFRERLFGKYGWGYRALIRFYVSHPRRLASHLERASLQAFRLRAAVLGNFEKSRGLPAGATTTRFGWWSALRLKLRPPALWLLVLFGGNLAACGAGYRRAPRRERMFRQALALLVVMAVTEFLVAALADALGDLARHLYVFHAMCDLILIADLGWLAQVALLRRSREERRGAIRSSQVSEKGDPDLAGAEDGGPIAGTMPSSLSRRCR